jgi:MYXO-CTERM domain-containing protein
LVLQIGLLTLLVPRFALAAEYYVAPTGSDAAAGSLAAPFATVGRAQTAAAAGDTVYIRGGTYGFSGSGTLGVSFTKSGQANNLIKYFAYQSEIPIFDLGNLTPSNRVTGLNVQCNYVHIRGLEVKGVRQYMSGQDSWGVRIQGNNNILENLNVHHNEAPGIFITSGANNLILNCDSHHNYDEAESGGSGDGFGCHSSGGGNIIRGCRGYDNSDDGYDFINAAGSCLAEKSFAFRNGWVPGSNPRVAAGNGAGFKSGGYGSPPEVPASGAATHTIRQCVAFDNRAQGFYANHHVGRINFHNNTAFKNAANFDMLADAGFPSTHEIRNNVATGNGGTISRLTGGTATSNSWNLGVTVSAADFMSMVEAEALAARQADGSLPNNSFMRLAMGSDLIDKGVDVGLPFNGSAPDLGAFESGGSSGMPGTGGATSTGGSSSNGGTANSGGTSTNAGRGGAGGAVSSGGTNTAGAPTNTGGNSNGGVSSSTGGALGTAGGSGTSAGTSASAGSVSVSGGTSSSGGASTNTGGSIAAGASLGSGGTVGTAGSNGNSAAAPGVPPASDAGCGCRVPPNPRSARGKAAGLSLLVLVLVAGLRRRRSL